MFELHVGGRLVYQTTKKRASGPKCPVTGKRIQGVCPLSPILWVVCRLISIIILYLDLIIEKDVAHTVLFCDCSSIGGN